MKALTNLCKDEQGASMAEYALLLALIAVATIGALQVLQGLVSIRCAQRLHDTYSNLPIAPFHLLCLSIYLL